MGTAGLLLAAGAGRRFGGPKALAEVHGEPLVTRAVRALAEGGCTPVVVVLGADRDRVRGVLARSPGTGSVPVLPVAAPDWSEGMGASLRAGLAALADLTPAPEAALVHLVDLPGIGADVIFRVRTHARWDALARAAYDGSPGHPVLFGARWWAEVAASAGGDRGARDWLAGRTDLDLVECGDLGTGADVDTPADLPPGPRN